MATAVGKLKFTEVSYNTAGLDEKFKRFTLDLDMNKKQPAKSNPCIVACPSLNLIPSKYRTLWL